jgi:DNA-directed RNA polymerase specialized sigma subunit
MMIYKIEHVDLNPAEKTRLASIMATGNKELKRYHAKAKEKCSLATFRKELFVACRQKGQVHVRGVLIPQSSLAAIMAVKDIEWRMLCGHGKFIASQSKRWKNTLRNSGLSFSDIYQEVVIGVINAIWNYDQTQIRFLTYVHNAIFNRMMGVANHSKPLSHLQDADIKLVGAYVKKRKSLATSGPVNFDAVVHALGLKPDQVCRLQKALQNVCAESNIRTGIGAIDENGGILQLAIADEEKPYIQTNDDESIESDAKPKLPVELMELIEKAELTPWEQAVLNAYLTGGAGWRTEVAKNHINPKTGKPFSRMLPILTMNKITKKLVNAA